MEPDIRRSQMYRIVSLQPKSQSFGTKLRVRGQDCGTYCENSPKGVEDIIFLLQPGGLRVRFRTYHFAKKFDLL